MPKSARFALDIMVPFIVSLAMFMESVDATIINTAIPVMANSFQVNAIDLKIALISYLLSLSVFIPISGWIADKFGIKRTFIIALIVFTISSCFCGLANHLWELTFARILQGLGGSLMLPLGRLIIVRTYEKHRLVNIMGQVVIVGALGMMLGPTLGGLITHYLNWRWIFYVNVPVGALNILLAYQWLTETKPQSVHALDKKGFILFGAGLALLTFGLSSLSETNIPINYAFLIIIGAIILLLLYLLHSRKSAFPIINIQLFQYRTFCISVLGNLLSRTSFGGLPFLLPLLFQIGFKYSPQLSGLLLAPMALGVLVAKPFSLRVLRCLGYKKLLITNTVLLGMTLCAFSWVVNETPLALIAFLTFLFGVLVSLQYTGMNSIAYSEIISMHYSSATSFMSTLQQLSQSFGVAISAFLLQIFSFYFALPTQISVTALHYSFVAMGSMVLFSIAIFSRLMQNDGAELLIVKNSE